MWAYQASRSNSAGDLREREDSRAWKQYHCRFMQALRLGSQVPEMWLLLELPEPTSWGAHMVAFQAPIPGWHTV